MLTVVLVVLTVLCELLLCKSVNLCDLVLYAYISKMWISTLVSIYVPCTEEGDTMEFLDDPRPASRIAEGYAFGAAGGLVAGSIMSVLRGGSGGLALILPMTLFHAVQIGSFQSILHSKGAASSRTTDFDPAKWGGAAVCSAAGAFAAAPFLRPFSMPAYVALTAAGAANITSFSHPSRLYSVAVGDLNTGMLGVDCAATFVTVLFNAVLFSRLKSSSLLACQSRLVAAGQGIVLCAVVPSVVTHLERLLQH